MSVASLSASTSRWTRGTIAPQPCRASRRARVRLNAAEEGPSTAAPSTQPPEPAAPYRREFQALGSKVIESDQAFEEPPASDLWEGEKFEALGQFLERWFLPALLVLGLICGGIAAGSYNNDAEVFIKPAAGPDVPMEVVPASTVTLAPAPATSD